MRRKLGGTQDRGFIGDRVTLMGYLGKLCPDGFAILSLVQLHCCEVCSEICEKLLGFASKRANCPAEDYHLSTVEISICCCHNHLEVWQSSPIRAQYTLLLLMLFSINFLVLSASYWPASPMVNLFLPSLMGDVFTNTLRALMTFSTGFRATDFFCAEAKTVLVCRDLQN